MFIRYFCHQTAFSSKRNGVSDKELSRVGLYWKPDVKFCRFLTKKGWIPDDYRELAFQHLVALSILEDFSKAITSIDSCEFAEGKLDLSSIPLGDDIKLYLGDEVNVIGDISSFVKKERAKFDIWAKNPKQDHPVFLQFDDILSRLAENMAEQSPRLEDIFFRIFVDEYENLQEDQQCLLNDHIKQPGNRFCLNIATRRNSSISTRTSGFERIVSVHDYRRVDLEREYLTQKGRSSFSLLAAEILLLRLYQAGFVTPPDIDLSSLYDKDRLDERSDTKYIERVKGLARQVFPQSSAKEVALGIMGDPPLKRRLKKLIEKGLKKHKADRELCFDDFLCEDGPEVSVVAGCILNRDKADPFDVLQEVKNFREGKPSKFSSHGDWLDANLHGGLFHLYLGLPKRPCLLYAGFDRFCQMARSNLRHFQELCHESFTIFEAESSSPSVALDRLVIPEEVQANAARFASENMVLGVLQLGTYGPQLINMVRNMGKLFQLSQKRPGQSEPEVNHFSISGQLGESKRAEMESILREARIWSVVYEERDTKNKGKDDIESVEYFPNPIYAPYFGISYRKKRKVTISVKDFMDIIEGDESAFDRIRKEYERKWSLVEPHSYSQGFLDV